MTSLPIVPALKRPDPVRSAPAAHQARPSSNLDLRDEDLHPLLVAFYDVLAQDELLAPYFVSVDMVAHLPRIVDFWSTLLFHTQRYTGNAFRPHLEMPGLAAEHFERWLATLEATLDASYAGPNVDRMKSYGHRIGYSMQLRLGIAPTTAYPTDQP